MTEEMTVPVPRRSARHSECEDLSIEYEGFHRPRRVMLPNLSPGGMFINTSEYYPQGAVLKLEFRLPRSQVVVRTRAEVRHCMLGLGIGVEFLDVPPEQQRAIMEELGMLDGENEQPT